MDSSLILDKTLSELYDEERAKHSDSAEGYASARSWAIVAGKVYGAYLVLLPEVASLEAQVKRLSESRHDEEAARMERGTTGGQRPCRSREP